MGQALPVHNLTKNTYYNTIQAALNDADNNNTIEVADGTYDETIDFPRYKNVILQSINGASSTTIRGDINAFTVGIDHSHPTIKGFTIIHAVGLMGGGILNKGTLDIYNCGISNNVGGGIACLDSACETEDWNKVRLTISGVDLDDVECQEYENKGTLTLWQGRSNTIVCKASFNVGGITGAVQKNIQVHADYGYFVDKTIPITVNWRETS